MPPDEPTDEEQLEELPEDNDTPFRPADPGPATPPQDDRPADVPFDDTRPETDTGIQQEELYDEGKSGAIDGEPPPPSDVVDYNPDHSGPPSDNSPRP